MGGCSSDTSSRGRAASPAPSSRYGAHPPRTKWTRRVPHPVRIGHAASLSQVGVSCEAPTLGVQSLFWERFRLVARVRRPPPAPDAADKTRGGAGRGGALGRGGPCLRWRRSARSRRGCGRPGGKTRSMTTSWNNGAGTRALLFQPFIFRWEQERWEGLPSASLSLRKEREQDPPPPPPRPSPRTNRTRRVPHPVLERTRPGQRRGGARGTSAPRRATRRPPRRYRTRACRSPRRGTCACDRRPR